MSAKAFPIFTSLVLFFVFNARAAVRYVDLNSTNAAPPFTDWTTAATNIQDAVDAAVSGDVVLVTNGVYATGGRVDYSTRLLVTNAVTVQSMNGLAVTVLDGAHTVRCAYLSDGAVLAGFTIRNGFAGAGFGGGVYCATTNQLVSSALVANCLMVSNSASSAGGVGRGIVSNCVISYNQAGDSGGGTESCTLYDCILSYNSSGYLGGGAAGGISTLYNCLVFGNSSSGGGGGVFGSTLINCIVVSNTCPLNWGGGALDSDLTNCIVCGNSAHFIGGVSGIGGPGHSLIKNSIVYYNSSGNYDTAPITNCCTTPLSSGTGNFTNAPLFVNMAAGDFHLASNSPCINAGKNAFVSRTADYDGNPRIVGGTVDMGAYEFQSPSSVLSYAWAEQYGLLTDGTADFTDIDGDGLNNWQEWIAGTVPTNSLSVLAMFSPSKNTPGLKVSWQSVNGRSYFLQRSTDLSAQPMFSAIQSNIIGQVNTTVYTDTTATNAGSYFYRVGVQ
jgi:hypothetical protein